MSDTQARSILEAVASGSISPSEASVLLDALSPNHPVEETERLEAAPPASESVGATEPTRVIDAPATAAVASAPVTRLQVSASLRGGPITIDCDPGTSTPYVDGPGLVRIDGNPDAGFVIDGELGDDAAIVLPAVVDLRLEADGSDFALNGIDGTLIAQLNVGNVEIEGRFVDGESRVDANAGNVHLMLHTGSDVEVIQRAPSGIQVGGLEHTGRGRWTLGGGTATFEIAGNLGSIEITTV